MFSTGLVKRKNRVHVLQLPTICSSYCRPNGNALWSPAYQPISCNKKIGDRYDEYKGRPTNAFEPRVSDPRTRDVARKMLIGCRFLTLPVSPPLETSSTHVLSS